MRALLCVSHGEPEGLVISEVATPEPGPGTVRIRVVVASVNYPDTLTIRDMYQFKPELPFAPGAEISGVIDAVGDGVVDLEPGQRVVALLGAAGGFAEYAIAAADQVFPVPDTLPLDVAGVLLFAHGTSLHALADRADAEPGETLLVLGAAGGVGLAAVELGVALGLRVIAAASTEEKLAVCREHGAHELVNYAAEDLRDRMRELGGADIVYDPVGGDLAEPALRSLRWLGRYLVVGFPAGIPRIPLNLVLLKGCDVRGVFSGEFTRRHPERHRAHIRQLTAWVQDGTIRPRISARFPLDDGAAAIRTLMDRDAIGKVLVEVSAE